MISEEKKFEVPFDERIMILPKARQELFINLVENYKVFVPSLHMIYGALNYQSELKVEYLVVFEVNIDGNDLIVWDAPFIYTNRALPAYRYAVRNNMHTAFFSECRSHLCRINRDKFFEFLKSSLSGNLTDDPNDSNYWKDPNNSHTLIKGLSDMSLLYIPEGFRSKKVLTKK